MSNIIDVLITIDTAGIIKDYSQPSQQRDNPTKIDKKYDYSVVVSNDAISGQAGDTLNIQAASQDTVHFFATSLSNNSQDAVIIYDITQVKNDTSTGGGTSESTPLVLTQLKFMPELRGAIRIFNPELFPETYQSVGYFQGLVSKAGSETFQLQFALYTRDERQELKLKGYYTWNTTLTVAS